MVAFFRGFCPGASSRVVLITLSGVLRLHGRALSGLAASVFTSLL